MQKSVVINHKLYDGEEVFSIPVFYDVFKDGNHTTYNCKVALTANRVPEWLTVTEFSIPIIYMPGSPGVTMTAFSDVKGIRNVDTAIFVTEAEQQIFVAEQYSKV
jgi:hypothetical protein